MENAKEPVSLRAGPFFKLSLDTFILVGIFYFITALQTYIFIEWDKFSKFNI